MNALGAYTARRAGAVDDGAAAEDQIMHAGFPIDIQVQV